MNENQLLHHLPKEKQEIVIFCIGTDRNTGDAFGPLCGMLIEEKALPHTFVYGTVSEPVMALNIEEKIDLVKKKHPDAFMIAIDAALGEEHEIGEMFVRPRAIRPGSVLNKGLPSVGDISILGIVNQKYENNLHNYASLNNTRLNTVLTMARRTSKLIEQTIYLYHEPKKTKQVVATTDYFEPLL